MALVAIALPILPGKTEAWEQWAAELNGPRRADYEDQRRRLGLKSESAFLQRTPGGDFAILVQEADDYDAYMSNLRSSKTPFDAWFNGKVEELHGLDLDTPMPNIDLRVKFGG
jgi:hypothetical protein